MQTHFKTTGQQPHQVAYAEHIAMRGDSTQGTRQGLVKFTLPFLKNIPLGSNLAFPAKHELAWQFD